MKSGVLESDFLYAESSVFSRTLHIRFDGSHILLLIINLGSGDLSPSTDRMLNRVKSVYLFIRRQGVVTTKELVEEFDMTQRTMQRDLNILTYNNLVRSPRRGQWMVTEKKVKVS